MNKSMFKHTLKYFNDHFDLMLRKGIYPYEYVTDISKFNEQNLPPKDAFHSTLSEGIVFKPDTYGEIRSTEISGKDYKHAQTVFKAFDFKNLGEYTELYCKSDVLLLADVFESFINICLKKCSLDPSHYITAPSLAMDAMLKMTGVELELLTDEDMYLFFEKGIRGGVSTITNRYMQRLIISIWMTSSILTNHQHSLYTLMQITYMDGLCADYYQLVVLSS